MKKLFSARSPFWQLLLYGVFFYAAILIAKQHETAHEELLQLNQLLVFIAAILLLVIATLYAITMIRYNRKNPKNPIRYWGLLPPELKEEDEGMRMFTAQATRRVYIFHATFLPILAILYAYLLPPPITVLGGLAFLTLGHYTLYLVTIWPILSEE